MKTRCGIYLGTTYSAICKMENGEPVIVKTDSLKDTLPTCVSFTKKKIVKVGDSAYNDLRSERSWRKKHYNAFENFTCCLGTDKQYYSSNMERYFSTEELTAEVLKTLVSYVNGSMETCVITIPAKFKTDQIAATKRAAKMAGIEHCELLQEPIAASMAYGLGTDKKDGYWLVFDFGTTTFSATLFRVEDGIMQVIDTEGDNYLGSINLDYSIVDEIIIPYLQENYVIDNIMDNDDTREILRDGLKFYAEYARNKLSFKKKCDITSQLDEFVEDDEGTAVELDMIITQKQLNDVVLPIFQKAVDICKALLQRNNLSGNKLDSLILVGSPTYSPVVREMLKAQITPNVDTSIDPITAVAKGAALFASTIDSEAKEEIKAGTIALDISYESNSVETLEFVAVKLLTKKCIGYIPSKLFVEFVRGDKAWSSGKVELNELGDVIECQLNKGKANAFSIVVYDDLGSILPCFPNEINITQRT